MTWATIFNHHKCKGCDPSDAAYRADQYEKRQKPNRRKDCRHDTTEREREDGVSEKIKADIIAEHGRKLGQRFSSDRLNGMMTPQSAITGCIRDAIEAALSTRPALSPSVGAGTSSILDCAKTALTDARPYVQAQYAYDDAHTRKHRRVLKQIDDALSALASIKEPGR